jgi:hypothetical protein
LLLAVIILLAAVGVAKQAVAQTIIEFLIPPRAMPVVN